MARTRLLRPGFFANEELARLSPLHRLLFAGLWTLADREGRLLDRPARIRTALFPYDLTLTTPNLDGMLNDLERSDFIVRYDYLDSDKSAPSMVQGAQGSEHSADSTVQVAQGSEHSAGSTVLDIEHAIAIRTFHLHQHPHVKEPPSVIVSPRKGFRRTFAKPAPSTVLPALGEHSAPSTVQSAQGSEHGASSPVDTDTDTDLDTEKYTADGPTISGGVEPNEDTPEPAPELPADHLKVITKLAHDVLTVHQGQDDDVLREQLKRACAHAHVSYDSAVVARALTIARIQQRRKGGTAP